jgi:hypothetical protein
MKLHVLLIEATWLRFCRGGRVGGPATVPHEPHLLSARAVMGGASVPSDVSRLLIKRNP